MKSPVRLFVLILLWVIGYLLLWPAGSRAEYVSITELQKEAAAGWHETYQAHGRTITVDIPIIVPNVGAFPVLRVEKQPAVQNGLLKDVNVAANSDNYLSFSQVSPNRQPVKKGDAWFRETFTLTPVEIDWDKHLTMDNPITAGEAITIFDQVFTRLYGSSWKEHFRLDNLWVTGRLYAYNRKTKDFGGPMNTWGGYEFSFAQALCGIPVLTRGPGGLSPSLQEAQPCPSAMASAHISAADDYSVRVNMVRILDMPCPDVPLLSLDAVKTEFEKWIAAGRLREVRSLSLGYGLCADPSTKGIYWAYPVWVLDGVLYKNASEEPMPPPEEGMDTRPTRSLYLPAQPGSVMPQFDEPLGGWQMPGLIRWEDVQ